MKNKFFIFCLILLSVCVALIIRNQQKILSLIVPGERGGDVRVVFLDIGQGDATYIQFPNGEDMLVDCGKDRTVLAALGRNMRFFDRTIDYLIVSHPDLDHYGGCIDVLRRYRIQKIVVNGGEKPDMIWKTFVAATKQEKEAEHLLIEREQTWQIGGAGVRFLYPDKNIVGDTATDSNNNSIVFLLTYGTLAALFPADAEAEEEAYLVEKYGAVLDVDVLKVGHHGSNTSSIQPFVDAASPAHAVISAGKDNSYGHPSGRVLRRLTRAGSRIWRTDEQGDILLRVYREHFDIRGAK